MKDKILPIFEIFLFTTVSYFIVAGYVDGLGSKIPYVYEIASAIIFIAILLASLSFLKDSSCRLSPVLSFGLSAFTFATIHLISTDFKIHQNSATPVLYFIIVISCGMIGYIRSWVFPILLFTIGEYLHHVLLINSFDISIITNETLTYFNASYLSILSLIISGLFPSIISLQLSKHVLSKTKIPLQPKTDPAPVTTTVSVSVKHPETTQINTKTQSLTSTGEFSSDMKMGTGYSVDELLASVVYFMKRNFKAYSALGFTYNSLQQTFDLNSFQSKSVNIRKQISIALGNGIIGKMGTDNRVFMSGDLSYYNSDLPYYSEPQEINSILSVAVVSEQNELLGALLLDSLDKNAFKDQDKEILKRFSSLAAALITNARMRIFQERAARTFQIFYQASHQLTTALNISDVFEVLFQMAPSVAHCTRQIAILFNEEKKTGIIHKIAGNSPDIPEGLEFSPNSGLYSFSYLKRRVVSINDYQLYKSKYYRFDPNEPPDSKLRSLIIFPILDDEFRCKGLYSIESDNADEYSKEVEQIFTTLVENASVAFTRALLYQKMEKLATTDGLTGLNNHRNFQELLSKEIERTRRYGKFTSLLLMDIDHFKSFNDTYGHPVGDLVLKEIAACIRKSIRLNDIPARYGGEEFTVIIPEANEQGAMIIAERIRTTIQNHIIVSLDRQLRVAVSIGVATYPTMAKSQQQLIDNADKALYYSKENGRNRVTIFAPGMGE